MREKICRHCLHSFVSPLDRNECICTNSKNENYMKTLNPDDERDCYVEYSKEAIDALRKSIIQEFIKNGGES